METRRLADVHPDMERFLEEDCYCPNEIYDVSGFFYQLFYPDTECGIVTQTEDASVVVACGARQDRPQCIYFWHDDGSGRIVDAQRVDATENNIGLLRDLAHGKRPEGRLNEYEAGRMESDLKKVFSMCDAVFVS